MHLRVLAEFLNGARPNGRADSLFADDYFAPGRWERRRNSLVQAHARRADQPPPVGRQTVKPFLLYNDASEERDIWVEQMLHKHLAHLTTTRATERHKAQINQLGRFGWHFVDPALVVQCVAAFIADLGQAGHLGRASWFDPCAPAIARATKRLAH